MYVIAGATGNTGKPIAEALLKAGKQVRIISREKEKAAGLVALGAELIEGSSTDRETLTRAFTGATAAYVLIPPAYQAPDFPAYQREATDAIASAIAASGIQNVVTLSSIGAHLTSGAGVVQGLHFMEKRLNQLQGVNILHLRPSYFLENTLGQVGAVKMMGAMGSPLRGDVKMPMISTGDIAAYAAKRLLALDFRGASHQDLLGAGDISYNELAPIYGAKVGKPDLQYMQLPNEAFKDVMLNQWHTSQSLADMMCEFLDACNAGKVNTEAVRNAESTTPTSVEQFADVFAYVYNQ